MAQKVWFATLFLLLTLPYSCKNSFATHDTVYEWERAQVLSNEELNLASRVDSFFLKKVKATGLNACVLVAKEGKVIYTNCFGYADYSKKKSLSDTSAFQIASVSKPITATAVLLLHEEKKLDIDDRVKKYIKGFPYEEITIRQLLNHRSGLANYIYLFDTLDLPANTLISNEDVVNYFVKHHPAIQAQPDRRFQYCNTNYALLAYIVEKVSRKSFEEFAQENIFEPAHMYHSFVRNVKNDTIRPNQCFGYTGSRWEKVTTVPYDGVIGDKGIYSTTRDLFLFDQALNHGLLLKQETLDEAYKGYSYEKPGQKNYGLGWRLLELPDQSPIVYHNGWWRGFTASFRRRTDEGTSIIILCNKYNRATYDLAGLYTILGMADTPDERGDT